MKEWLELLWTVLDIGLVIGFIYIVLIKARGTRFMQILKGMGVIVVLWLLADTVGLDIVSYLFSQGLVYGILGAMIIFQPELRQLLERIGKRSMWTKGDIDIWGAKQVKDLVEAVYYMSDRKIGALISIERGDSLESYAKTGIALEAKMSKELVENIFTPNVPLHDGALVIREGRLEAASCYLPLSENEDIPKELGTRHRAAIGLAEDVDAWTIVVSEETGMVSLVKDGKIFRGMERKDLEDKLNEEMSEDEKK